jgi:RsmE family RNA methyltransferase
LNLLLLHPEELEAADSRRPGELRAHVRGRRLEHVRRIHRALPGDTLRVGVLGGRIGEGRVVSLGDEGLELAVELDREPPEALPATLVLALPRPLVLKRVLIHATTLGLKRIALIHASRVEKSYWQSDAVSGEAVERQLMLGLEQAGDTVLPEVSLHRRFRPFVEDELKGLLVGCRGFVAHPEGQVECPRGPLGPLLVAVGPEGGFIPYEIDRLVDAGLHPVQLGARILRVEAAVPALIARLT